MFIKNDEGFICKNCGHEVEKLKYTSRDHCNKCLYSLHVDIFPGDRLNECKGLLKPVCILDTGKKKMQIEYTCTKCKATVRNIIAEDDSEEQILKVMEDYARRGGK
ncbi:MAG: RNHCP domain-containing protein [Clostridia bacterium]|nr:RNHCP domain-containing protein [Clostridia bacterium]